MVHCCRSGSYQIRTSLPTEKQQTLLNHITPHSGVILEPSTAGQPTLQQGAAAVAVAVAPAATAIPSPAVAEKKHNISKVLKGVAVSSISGSSNKISRRE
ncbi:hypothetical protein NQ318_004160 [Aromia moschata]|uniref:Uncharacterized protein n=1 Tax=Aromia moschata TaxID=1265417 RepID=A0AAV8YPZ7_9CUCU|nr:hypothetical protein NQ318_004160 [Aromia moschata]